MSARRFSRSLRGQAATELALGLLVLVPTLLLTIFLAESATFRLEATEAATEPLWDATAYAQQAYSGGGTTNKTPGARGAAVTAANKRMKGASLLFTQADAPSVACGPAGDMVMSIGATSSIYAENGGISCTSQLRVGAKGLTRHFIDQGAGAMFKEPLSNLRRNFDFAQTRKGKPFKMAIGDWGLTNQGTEDQECNLTMDGCANDGFFGAAKATYTANQGAGTTGQANIDFMNALINKVPPPKDYPRVLDFQMSFQGESPGPTFMEDVPVIEGDREWRTTPFFYNRKASYDARNDAFLGL